jgi:hypothetical protein
MSVTPTRFISGKLSGSRNETPSPYAGPSIDATSCHHCRIPFQRGQMRYPILDDTTAGWDLVSVCMDCFKACDARSHDPAGMQKYSDADSQAFRKRFGFPLQQRKPRIAARQEGRCPGCGEPIFVSPNLRRSLQFCSLRCCQRDYRKRRRDAGSSVDWKGGAPSRCAACNNLLKSKRRDAKFCSNKCRQRQYRRRAILEPSISPLAARRGG